MTQDDFVLDHDLLVASACNLPVPKHVAVVGAGRWARVVCRVLAEFSPGIEQIHLVAERNFAATKQWLEEQRENGAGSPHAPYRNVVLCSSLGEVVEQEGVEVAFVTRMASQHYEATRRLLLGGKHVLVEKPFVLRLGEAEDLVRLARERNRVLAVGYEFMFARPLHYFREILKEHPGDASRVDLVWSDVPNVEKWGIKKQLDLSANAVTDALPHALSLLFVLFGKREIKTREVRSRDGCWQARLELLYGSIPVSLEVDKEASEPRRSIAVTSARGVRLELDLTREPAKVTLDGEPLPEDPRDGSFPRSLTAEFAYFFAEAKAPRKETPNMAENTVHFVEATERANEKLVDEQSSRMRALLWGEPPDAVPETALKILRHHLLDPLLTQHLVESPKDVAALDVWGRRAFRIVHRFSDDPWTTEDRILTEEGLDPNQLIRLNAAIRQSDFLQRLMVREGRAYKYWQTILPLIETGSIDAALTNAFHFPLRVGIYAAVSCMFYCSFCGRKHGVRYSAGDIEPGNDVFDQIFSEMPKGVSTLSLGGGLEPLTNPRLDDVIRSAKKYGHKVPLVTNGYMLTPSFVRRHQGLWELDVFRISCYGVDEQSYLEVTKRPGAFQLVKSNLIEFLKERNRRGSPLKVGLNFIVLINSTGQILRLLDAIRDINEAVGGPGVDFLTLREDFSVPETEGLTAAERVALVEIFQEFKERQRRQCPSLKVDFGYALYPLSEGVVWRPLAMVTHDGMLPKAYPQVSVAVDLLGDVYLYRDAAFLERPGADRYIIGRVSRTHSLEAVVREFLDSGREIPPLPADPELMDAFDHVVTKVIWQADADRKAGIPFSLGPVRYRARPSEGASRGQVESRPVNYWQSLLNV